MTWAAFGKLGKLGLAFVSCRMNSFEYEVLLETLLQHLRRARGLSLVFKEDDAAIHVSLSTKSRLQEQRIQLMDCPACSADFNPADHSTSTWAVFPTVYEICETDASPFWSHRSLDFYLFFLPWHAPQTSFQSRFNWMGGDWNSRAVFNQLMHTREN